MLTSLSTPAVTVAVRVLLGLLCSVGMPCWNALLDCSVSVATGLCSGLLCSPVSRVLFSSLVTVDTSAEFVHASQPLHQLAVGTSCFLVLKSVCVCVCGDLVFPRLKNTCFLVFISHHHHPLHHCSNLSLVSLSVCGTVSLVFAWFRR